MVPGDISVVKIQNNIYLRAGNKNYARRKFVKVSTRMPLATLSYDYGI